MFYFELMIVEAPNAGEDSYNSLEWWYDLDQPFVAHSELLSDPRSYDTRLVAPGVTYEASVLLPRLPVEDYRIASYLAPPHGWSATSAETSEEWGIDYKDPAMGVVGVVVKRLAFVATLPPEDTVPAHLRSEWGLDIFGIDVRNEIDAWWDRVRTWLEISTGQGLAQVGAKQQTWNSDSRTRIWLASSGVKREEWKGGGTEITCPQIVHGVNADVFEACAALSEVEPPLAWTLLRDARALQGVGQYRRAVIDAATAAELAVGELLDDRLKNVEKVVREALLESKPMLGSRTALLEKLGQGLPKSFTDRLVNKRNKAVHRGVDPTLDECESAIREAVNLVERVFPLPAPPGAVSSLVCRW
ncbi:hypothetical protein A5647_24815 [Mycobacterium sp. 1100029.7]|nr:hypothetical protein A5647_24815 [Mycobacterium sp. 1100029.7]